MGKISPKVSSKKSLLNLINLIPFFYTIISLTLTELSAQEVPDIKDLQLIFVYQHIRHGARGPSASYNSLFIDGVDVNFVTIRSVRDGVAFVPQDNFLFSDTIENNIAFGIDGEHESDEVEHAAVLSAVHGNISEFEEGYKTVLGERGVTVSGGQKQRISIARALMKDAPILILDDSVSAVDTDTEKVILENLRSTRQGKTTILIAHRISTIEGLDKIVFVEDGRIVAVGSHEQLLLTCPAYGRMVELQRLEDESRE